MLLSRFQWIDLFLSKKVTPHLLLFFFIDSSKSFSTHRNLFSFLSLFRPFLLQDRKLGSETSPIVFSSRGRTCCTQKNVYDFSKWSSAHGLMVCRTRNYIRKKPTISDLYPNYILKIGYRLNIVGCWAANWVMIRVKNQKFDIDNPDSANKIPAGNGELSYYFRCWRVRKQINPKPKYTY